ncbi:hypothetical protein HSR122_3040 [Halapricum desulfuricans]|uniref:Uncharacterized protein n=1 Tax=Halapricum desulfuricans TaxID=2841257 RepID=A0A897NHP3_9EURY|nr:hypothetical protein HSR122_3040 [Halapricum desulfuricans]
MLYTLCLSQFVSSSVAEISVTDTRYVSFTAGEKKSILIDK